MVRKMEVVGYSPEWARLFEEEAQLLSACLGDEIIRCHHIGSTAVLGLAAKPIIDILLEVRSVESLDQLQDAMRALGYESKGEFGIPGRRYFPKGGDHRTHHVHAFNEGDPHVVRHLVFRDYLRTHPEAVIEYASVKREASKRHATEPEGYVAFKQAFVEQTIERAVHWARRNETS